MCWRHKVLTLRSRVYNISTQKHHKMVEQPLLLLKAVTLFLSTGICLLCLSAFLDATLLSEKMVFVGWLFRLRQSTKSTKSPIAFRILCQVSVWQSAILLQISCKSVQPVPVRVEQPVSPVSSSGDATSNPPFPKMPKCCQN